MFLVDTKSILGNSKLCKVSIITIIYLTSYSMDFIGIATRDVIDRRLIA